MTPNWYERHLLPHLLELACGGKPIRRQRQKVLPLAQGDVLGISGRSGLAGYPHLHFIVVDSEPTYPYHGLAITFRNAMHGAGRYGLQCLTNLDQLPPTGAVLICPPLKILRGSGSPLRVLALVPRR